MQCLRWSFGLFLVNKQGFFPMFIKHTFYNVQVCLLFCFSWTKNVLRQSCCLLETTLRTKIKKPVFWHTRLSAYFFIFVMLPASKNYVHFKRWNSFAITLLIFGSFSRINQEKKTMCCKLVALSCFSSRLQRSDLINLNEALLKIIFRLSALTGPSKLP